MNKVILLAAVILFSSVGPSFALEWKKLHEEADKISLPLALAAAQKDPASVEDRYVLALVYLNAHKDEEAKEIFNGILKDDPSSVEAKWGVAEVMRRQHQIKESEKLCREVIGKDSQFSPAYITLAYVRYLERDFNGSVRLAAFVISQRQKRVDLSNYVRAHLLYAGAKGSIAHYGGPLSKILNGAPVLAKLKKAESLQPDSAAVKYGLGSFYLLAPSFVGGGLGPAEEYLTKAVELDPKFANAYVRLAEVYKAKGQMDKFRSYLDKALEVDPGSEVALDVKSGACKFVCYEKGE